MFDSFPRLFGHMAWADEQILSSLGSDDRELDEAVALFAHVIAAESIWLRRIRSLDLEGYTPWMRLERPEIARLAAANAEGYAALLAERPDLDRIVAYKTTKGDPMATALGDILLHVALHGAYHRGQVASRLRALGRPVPPTDFVVFSRLFPPASPREGSLSL